MASVSWDELKAGIREAFTADRVDIDQVKRLMGSYRSSRDDWGRYGLFDPHRYTRNLVDEGNGSYNLIVLCWGEGQGSSIHNHVDSHCFMKVLSGSVKETMYSWPSESEGQLKPMEQTGCNMYYTDDVTYINDTLGLHRVENPSHTDPAVSLHLYCPPITNCKSFEERTSHSHQCKVTFYSKDGELVQHRATC